MFSRSSASARLAQSLQDQEILMWRYATAATPLQKQAAGLRLLAVRLRRSLTGAFLGAVFGSAPAPPAFAAALREARVLGPEAALRRTMAAKDAIERWAEAKAADDFSIVGGSMNALLGSIREEAHFLKEQGGSASPYEALLRTRTPGFSMEVFEGWVRELVPYCAQAMNETARQPRITPDVRAAVPKMAQQGMMDALLARAGFDRSRGRVKESPHPLCLGAGDDVRIGMTYDTDDAVVTVLSVLHESGHALYRQNLPRDVKGVEGRVAGTGMDEAMALLYENHVGRDPGFCGFIASLFPPENGVDAAFVQGRATAIQDRPIRTMADEVRYPLDVILRYRLEKSLIDEGMDAARIPARWAADFKSLTGMAVNGDSEGALQDIHWYGGEFGWFPNYLIGQLAAAQLFEAAIAARPEIPAQIGAGNFVSLNEWLRENVWRHGATKNCFEIVAQATGAPLGTASWQRHIESRYLTPLRAPVAAQCPKLIPR